MRMSLTDEQREEVLGLQRIAKQYEGIIRTSRNPDQVSRAKIELKKIRDKIDSIAPGELGAELAKVVASESQGSRGKRTISDVIGSYPVLSRFPIQQVHVLCDDIEVNILGSVLQIWETSFTPALSKAKLEFSLSAEKDSHFTVLETLKRQLKILIDAFGDVQNAIREDAKAQMREMRQRLVRQYLNDGGSYLKKLRDFYKIISEDITAGGTRCFNKEDTILIDSKLESGNIFQGKKVRELLTTSFEFLSQAVQALNLPDLPGKDLK